MTEPGRGHFWTCVTLPCRRGDKVSLWIVVIALGQLLTVGVAAYGLAQVTGPLGTADCPGCPQAILNQKLTDHLDDLGRRLETLERLGIDGRLQVFENVAKTTRDEIDRLRQLNTAIFVGLAMNLVATIVQIRTQMSRRQDSRGRT